MTDSIIKLLQWYKTKPKLIKILLFILLVIPIGLVITLMILGKKKKPVQIINANEFATAEKNETKTQVLPESKTLDKTLEDVLKSMQ